MNSIVCKFGGSSLASAENIRIVANIIEKDKKQFVVVSAPGKRFDGDIKVTDLLISCYKLKKKKKSFDDLFNKIRLRFEELIYALKVDIDLKSDFDNLYDELNNCQNYDYILSRGEYLTAKIISKLLNYNFLDAKDFIVFNKKNKVNLVRSKKLFKSCINKELCYVIPGFYGKDENNKIKVFSRGGSDITGAIVAVLANLQKYENFTDVDGVFDIDPRKCKKAEIIKMLSYKEMRVLSSCGAGILHQDCLEILDKNDIVLNIRNTFKIGSSGSFILPNHYVKNKSLCGITGEVGYVIINIEALNISRNNKLLQRIVSNLNSYNKEIKRIIEGVDNISLIVKDDDSFIEEKIEDIVGVTNLNISLKRVALISIVGLQVKENRLLQNKIFDSLGKISCRVLAIVHTNQDISFTIGVEENKFEETLNFLHDRLF